MITTRRAFIQLVAASGGALVLGVRLSGDEPSGSGRPFEPNAWIRLDPDGAVTLRVGKSEMGQGVRTSLPMILVEEMDVDFDRIRIEQASPGEEFRDLGTGGSDSVAGSYDSLRAAGATARAMLIAAAAETWKVDAKDCRTISGAVRHERTGRQLAYGALASAAAKRPVPANAPLKAKPERRILGRNQRRIDGPDIVTGRARYGIDARIPGMLFAVVARPPKLQSSVVSVDAVEAKKVPGVRQVVEIPTGVAVVATNTWAAIRGRDALQIEWSTSPAHAFSTDEHRKALAKATETPGVTIRKDGAGRAAMDGAARKIEALYLYPFAAHASVEPVNSTALVEDGKCTIWTPSQTPNGVQSAAARLLGIPPSAVTVNVMLLGGGFGRRLGVDFDREAVEIARRLPGTPMQLLFTREDDMRHGYFQAASAHRLIAGLDESGNILAWEHRKASTPHNARRKPTQEELTNPDELRGNAWGVYDTPYFFPAVEMTYAVVDAPTPIGPWRAVFSPSSVFARESFVDELAHELRVDPFDLRMKLLGAGDDSVPRTYTIDGELIDRPRLRRVLELVASKSGWGSEPPPGRGRGLACNYFHSGTNIAYVVEVSLVKSAPAGRLPFRVDRVVCAIDCGLVVNPNGVRQQVESGIIWSLSNMKNEITVRDGAIVQESFTDFPVVMIDETPPVIETHIVESDDEQPRGIGEPVVCPFAPAVTNALARVVGRRLRELPVRLA